jgi:hypothetical protein
MRPRAAGLLWLLAACSNLSTTEGGIASVEIAVPSPAEVEAGQSLQLTAVARGTDGEVLDVPVYWRALDTTIAVDSVEGILTGIDGGLSGRVIARAVDLYSRDVAFNVLHHADTLILVGDSTITVPSGQTASPPMSVRVEGGDPRAPVDKRRVTFEVVYPVFASPAERTIEFPNGQLAQNFVTATTGTPSPPATLVRRTGQTAPDTVLVRVSIFRPGGGTVPGSGQHFLLLFLP